jgi:hypothetical protein
VLVNGWEEMPQEPTEHDFDDTGKRQCSTPLYVLFFWYLSRNFKDEIFV